MSAAVSLSELPPAEHQRARGELRIAMRRRDNATVLAELHQQGCLKALFPRPTAWAEAVTLNTSGGIAGGDCLETHLRVQPGASATFAAQAAERFYRALPGAPPATIRTSITIDTAAAAEWLPQESILFDQCALDRVLAIDIAEDGWFLGVESLIFGRAAMGETLRQARVRDTIRIRRAGKLLLHDAIRLDGDLASRLARKAIANGAHCIATLIHIAPDAETLLDALRDAWANAQAGASAWNGMLIGRVVAQNGACLRRNVMAGLQTLRAGRPLPRVWLC
jgi:urease accessory protein